MQAGKHSLEKSLQTLCLQSNLLSWQWDPASQLIKLWESIHSDACSHQGLRMLGIFLELLTMPQLSLDTNNKLVTSVTLTIHMSAHAQMMLTIFHNFLETLILLIKQSSATALKLQAMLSQPHPENDDQIWEIRHIKPFNLVWINKNRINWKGFILIMNYLFIYRCH